VSILLLDVVNNNSKFPFVGKKKFKNQRTIGSKFLGKEKKRKSQNNKLPH
jgi:hypothetical protein